MAGLRLLHLPAATFAAVTAAVLAYGAEVLARRGQLGPTLVGGWHELLAPGLVALVCVVAVCEQLWPAERHRLLARGQVQDAAYFLLYACAVVPVMTLLSVGFGSLLGGHLPELSNLLSSWPRPVTVIATLVAMDGCNWLAHLADHKIGVLWRFHAVHHSQEELSVLTSFRAHPFVHTAGFLLATVPVVALSGGHGVAPGLITAYVCLSTLSHANVRWSFGALGRIVVSPAYHRLHHSIDLDGSANLGIVLTLWDVLARRAIFPVEGEVCRTGLEGRPYVIEQSAARKGPASVLALQLVEPFARSRGSV